MMNYFCTKNELLEEINKAVDAVFSAVAKMFGDEDNRLNERLKKMERDFLLLINTMGQQTHQSGNKRRNKMEEERATRSFEEVLDEVIDRILQSEDHDLIILVDELEKSAKEETEKKEIWKKKMRKSYRKAKELLQEEGEKGKAD